MLAHLSSICFAYNLSLMFGLGAIPNLLQLLLMLTTQRESPATLALRGKPDEARRAVEVFYGPEPQSIPTKDAMEQHLSEALNTGTRGVNKLSTFQVYS